jgi:hypothetical protein
MAMTLQAHLTRKVQILEHGISSQFQICSLFKTAIIRSVFLLMESETLVFKSFLPSND